MSGLFDAGSPVLATTASASTIPCPPERLTLGLPAPDLFAPGLSALASQVAGRRFLALHLPGLATEGLGPGPFLLWRMVGPRRQVAAVDPLAAAQGLYPGQALADAQALLPGVLALPEDPARAATRLRALALRLLRFTPLVACDPPDGLLLDITGAAHLFGGEAALMRRARHLLEELGHRSAAALAGTAPAAAALARAHPRSATRASAPSWDTPSWDTPAWNTQSWDTQSWNTPPGDIQAGGTKAGGVKPRSGKPNPAVRSHAPASPRLPGGEGGHGVCVASGQEAAALAPLPLEALRLPPEMLPRLHKLGLRRIGQLLEQPRGPLARRFGPGLLALLDAATGASGSSIRPVAMPVAFTAARDFLEPLITRGGIDAAVALLLPELCRALAAEGMGLRKLCLRAHRVDGGVQELRLGTGSPVRDPAHLARLLRDRLEQLEPGFGFERIALLAEHAEPLAAIQPVLEAGGAAGAAGASTVSTNPVLANAAWVHPALAQLLDRLTQRLPAWRPQLRASHWPERAVVRVSPAAAPQALPTGPALLRPVRLLPRPEVIQAGLVAGQLVWRGRPHGIRHAEGPERLQPEWWRDRPDRPFRDYVRVECEDGIRLWICRSGADPQRWFLHGFFA